MKAKATTVLLKKSRKTKTKPDTLSFTVKCDQAASVKLTGTITVTIKHKHKQLKVGAVRGSAKQDVALTLTVKLPSSAISDLKHNDRESAVFVLSASNANGSSTATTKIGTIHHKL